MTRRPPEVTDFPPQFLAILKAGADREIALPVGTKPQCVTYRHQLHRCRAAMRRSQHPWAEEVEAVTISFDNRNGLWYLVLRPRAKDLLTAIDSLGLQLEEPPAPPKEPAEPAAGPVVIDSTAIEDYLKGGRNDKS